MLVLASHHSLTHDTAQHLILKVFWFCWVRVNPEQHVWLHFCTVSLYFSCFPSVTDQRWTTFVPYVHLFSFFKKNYFYPVLQNLYIPESSEALSLVLLTKLLWVLRKLFLIRTQKCAIIAQPDGWAAGWNVKLPSLHFGSRKCYSSRGGTLWLKYLRQDRNVMAWWMRVTVTHGWTDYGVQTVEQIFQWRCPTLLCWG